MYRLILLLTLLSSTLSLAAKELNTAKSLYQTLSATGKYQVKILDVRWTDKSRNRLVPARIYYPVIQKESDEKFPLLIFSHGLGGTMKGYKYLGGHWASHGYICIHPQHVGSDDSVWKPYVNDPRALLKAMQKAAFSLKNAANRPADVTFLINEITGQNKRKEFLLYGKVDLDKIGMAGHSFGAYTTLAVIGRNFVNARGKVRANFRDKRIKAAIPMSSQRAKGSEKQIRLAWAGIIIPTYHITGTKDSSVITPETKPEDRLQAYYYSVNSNRYLLNLYNANHMAFSDSRSTARRRARRNPVHHKHIKTSTLAFWNAKLKKESDMEKWLESSFKKHLSQKDIFEFETLTPAKTTGKN